MQIFNQCHKERLTHQRVAATGLASLAFITVESGIAGIQLISFQYTVLIKSIIVSF